MKIPIQKWVVRAVGVDNPHVVYAGSAQGAASVFYSGNASEEALPDGWQFTDRVQGKSFKGVDFVVHGPF